MIPWRVVIAVAALIVLSAGTVFVISMIRDDAARDQIDAIKQQNQEAGDAGESARRSRVDCIADGLRWDFERSFCVREN